MKIALALYALGAGSNLLHRPGFASSLESISPWRRSALRSDDGPRARAEQQAICGGLWPPTSFLLGKMVPDIESAPEEQAARARQARGEPVADVTRAAAQHGRTRQPGHTL